ncbi:hypothetical protein HPB51_007442 [Rhipicephalus microplus]|uniref:CCHC-type domain-containing protein n=1 Tax=Rhipicephalus microplus TaxID=6941 RepID=A0A9J6EZG3_RHIMP|nr:hypothetical protein HPB51_007442 [Rhipicephalus microplus]
MQGLANALQKITQAPVQTAGPLVKVGIPTYTGYLDCKSANEYLDRLLHYEEAKGLSDTELLDRMLAASLTKQAARWFRLIGHRARTVPRSLVLSDRPLDPYTYALRMAHARPARDIPRQEHAVGTRPNEPRNPERGPPDRGDLRSGRRGVRGPCYRCGVPGHIARECNHTPGQEETRGSGNGRHHQ